MDKNYDFQKKEEKWQKFWEKEGIFKFKNKKNKKIFSIDTPPPTLSGKMHLGHVFSYTHQDIIARYRRMKGENVFYPFGVDNNGLPTEKLVEKIKKIKLFDIGRKDFIELCQKTIKEILPDFINDWKKIGISCDFSNTYSTISYEVQKISQLYFIDLFNKNRIYKKYAPVLWCFECRTAISQADMNDREMESIFYDIEFKTLDEKTFIVSTTRPEFLPSCVAVFINPKDKKNQELIGKIAITPLFHQRVKILEDINVDPCKGSGIVMCCTFGDARDVEWYFKHNLPLRVMLEKNGKTNNLAKEFQNLSLKTAREKIVENLKKSGLVKKEKAINHILNVHERCLSPVEIIATNQWFIKYLDLKKEFLNQANKLKWHPPYMKKRLDNWIKGLKWDWCISRQRYFGVPIPAWECKACGKIITPPISNLPLDPLHSNPQKSCECGSREFIPESDVLDTWATSSLTPQIAAARISNKKIRMQIFPMSLRPQAHDIINFWLFYTLARSFLHQKEMPWKNVMISGFVLDQKGEKMSKSKGNIIQPEVIIKQYGVDAIRFWAAQSNLGDDLRYSEEEIKTGKRTVVKLWNASQFCLQHIKDYVPRKLEKKHLADEDKWILSKMQKTIKSYMEKMEKYEYASAKLLLDNFFWKNFCDNYLEIVKSRVYENKNEKDFKVVQSILYLLLLSVLKLYAPIMPHITEEIYQEYFRKYQLEKSIHKTPMPKFNKRLYFPKQEKDFELAIDTISQIRKYKSEKNLSMKAEIESVIVRTKDKTKAKKYFPLIAKLLSVQKIEIVN